MVENMIKKLIFTGQKQPSNNELDEKGNRRFPYLLFDNDNKLLDAVNLAITLNRPLLIKGEPGCGKTQLARAVAYELGLDFKFWAVKSTSCARDGLYTYDGVRRVRDAALKKEYEENNYIKFGPLGFALNSASDKPVADKNGTPDLQKRVVVLIDEIDKADIDFPNDLLLELDEMRFEIPELDSEVIANRDYSPIIFVTSNDEKDLPDAFLRRCIFHYIKFPSKEHLMNIINAHFPDSSEKQFNDIVEIAIEKFLKIRTDMDENFAKKVSTSELIDWYRALLDNFGDNKDDLIKKLQDSKLLFPGVLIKNWHTYSKYTLE